MAHLAHRLSDSEWEKLFANEIQCIHGDCSYEESAAMLSKLVKSGLLRFTDLQHNPARFFQAHRLLLAPNRTPAASGFGVRFTVEFNLFAGSILGVSYFKYLLCRIVFLISSMYLVVGVS